MAEEMKFSPAAVLTMYAAFLAAGALFALLLIGFGEAVSLGIMSALSFAAAYASRGAPKKGDAGYKLYMIGVHAGLLLPIIFSALIAWDAFISFLTLSWISSAFHIAVGAGSLASFVWLVRLKPKKGEGTALR